MPDVIEERDEKDEEERKTAQGLFQKGNQPKVQSQQLGQSLPLQPGSQGQSTPQVPGTGLTQSNQNTSGPTTSMPDRTSQSRIKVALNQQDNMNDTMGMTGGMEDTAYHMIQPKPTLTAAPSETTMQQPQSPTADQTPSQM